MPLPWKKNRVTRISQIVADLQSPRRGGSLVVETGFPTSLIDLFVKNRSRFTRSKSKRPLQPDIYDPPSPSPSTPETSSSGDLSVVRAHAPSLTPLVTVNDGGDNGGVSGSEEVNRVGECGCGSYSKSVLASSVKVKALFVVVVLISSVMKLTVEITMAAVTLLFLENVGKRFVGWWRTVGIIMEPFPVTVCNCVWFQKLMKLKSKKGCDECEEVAGVGGVGLRWSSSSCLNEIIEVVESESRSGVGGCCGKKLLEEVTDSCEEGSLSGRFRSKMVKKLVPKKWRSSLRKTSKESEGESRRSGKEDKCSREDEIDDNNGMMMTWVEEEEEEEGVIRIYEVGKCCSWGYVIVLATVLGGLLMGRLAALILTLASCFLLKMRTKNQSKVSS